MQTEKDQNKLTVLAVKQNLLIWQLSQSYLDVEKKIVESLKKSIDD